ncbi:MAG: hypothetical protein GY719_26150 [bacterium]|nr:hypothetical protein [bacterium]
MARDWSAEFNALPLEVRTVGAALEFRTRIQHLKMEKRRLKKRYRQSCREIDDHIRNCERALRDLERREPAGATEGDHDG